MTSAALSRLISRSRHVAGGGLRRAGTLIAGSQHGAYIPARQTVAAARSTGQTVEAYVESMWDQTGETAAIVERMRSLGALEPAGTVVEIGAGTGRYLARVREIVKPDRYVVFETADDWRAWLVEEYGVEGPATGEALSGVARADLVHAHGVFVYTPTLITAAYLAEIERVAPRWVVFDVITETELAPTALCVWLSGPNRFPAIVPRDWMLGLLPSYELLDEWTVPYGSGQSRYFALRRRA